MMTRPANLSAQMSQASNNRPAGVSRQSAPTIRALIIDNQELSSRDYSRHSTKTTFTFTKFSPTYINYCSNKTASKFPNLNY